MFSIRKAAMRSYGHDQTVAAGDDNVTVENDGGNLVLSGGEPNKHYWHKTPMDQLWGSPLAPDPDLLIAPIDMSTVPQYATSGFTPTGQPDYARSITATLDAPGLISPNDYMFVTIQGTAGGVTAYEQLAWNASYPSGIRQTFRAFDTVHVVGIAYFAFVPLTTEFMHFGIGERLGLNVPANWHTTGNYDVPPSFWNPSGYELSELRPDQLLVDGGVTQVGIPEMNLVSVNDPTYPLGLFANINFGAATTFTLGTYGTIDFSQGIDPHPTDGVRSYRARYNLFQYHPLWRADEGNF
jgi:hypothetical protein